MEKLRNLVGEYYDQVFKDMIDRNVDGVAILERIKVDEHALSIGVGEEELEKVLEEGLVGRPITMEMIRAVKLLMDSLKKKASISDYTEAYMEFIHDNNL